jgi:K+-sensing histidine kinase KdpD
MSWSPLRPYAVSIALVAIVTSLGIFTRTILRAANIDIVYLLVVLVIALRWGMRPAIFSAVLSAIVFTFSFVPPYFTFAITDLAYLTTLIGFLAVGIATSALASRARQLTRAQEARARADARSEAKDQIINKISHELRSPVTSLLVGTQLLTRAGLDPTRASKTVKNIERSGRLLARLVDDLVMASRINSGKLAVDRRPITIDSIVASTVEVMAITAEQKGIHVDAVIDPVGPVLADEERIEQITTNLLSNAIKFTPSGGRISVHLHRKGANAELVVSDTGLGIPSAFLPHVFEQFSQGHVDDVKTGLGLGLSIVNHLVDAHGGTISVASDGTGKGTTFTVRLPAISIERS